MRSSCALDLGDEHIDSGTPVEGFRSALLDHMMKREAQHVDNRSPARVGEEHHEKRAAVMGEALQHRVNPAAALSDGAREYRGFTLLDMAREALELRGDRTRGLSRDEIAQRALAQRSGAFMSSSDFPVILGNVINTSLRAGYDQAPQTFRPLVREVSAADFKAINRAQLGEGPAFDKINESGEYKRGSLVEAKESYGIATFGKVIAITRKVIVNDDMNAFGRIPQLLGQSAAQLESDLVWYQILANPVMGDGTALFHASHKNLQTGAPSAFAVASLGTGRATMAKQVGLDGKTVLNVRPQYVIVPVALETKAEQELKTLIYNSDSSKAATASMRSLEIITEARLDNGISNPAVGADVAGSATAWYLAASPSQIDTVELAYSVAEHSTLMARYLAAGHAPEVAMWALLHDASEAYLVDVPRPVKPYLTGYKDAEARIMDAVADRFGLPRQMPAEVKDADDRIIADELVNLRPMAWHARHNRPLGVRLRYWAPDKAETEFLATYVALDRALGRAA